MLCNTISHAVLQPHEFMITPTKGHGTLIDFLVNIGSYADEPASDGKRNVDEVQCRPFCIKHCYSGDCRSHQVMNLVAHIGPQ